MNKTAAILILLIFSCSFSYSQTTDTVPASADTVVRIPEPRKDTLRRVAPRVTRKVDTVQVSNQDTSANIIASPSGPDLHQLLRRALADHPYFNFLGKPQLRREQLNTRPHSDLMFYVILGLFFYFAVVKTLFSKYVNNLTAIFLRISLRQQQLREQVLQTPLPSLLLNFFFLMSGGFYTSLLLAYHRVELVNSFWLQTFYIILILAVIYTGKFIILKSVGWIFNVSRAMDTYIFIVFLVNKMLGILLLPFIVLIVFEPGQLKQVFVTLSLILIIVMFLYRFVYSYKPISSEIKMNLLHFFIYLCAFELAPLLLIYKVLLTMVDRAN